MIISPIGLQIKNPQNRLNSQMMTKDTLADSQNSSSTPMNYHKNLFLANQNISASKLSFKETPTRRIDLLRRALSSICEEAITHYDNRNVAISHNLFTRSFIHHGLEFSPQKENNYHSIKDPFHTCYWDYYIDFKNKNIGHGQTAKSFTNTKLRDAIKNWNERFLDIIGREKIERKNNLLDQLLNSSSDIDKIKQLLGINF